MVILSAVYLWPRVVSSKIALVGVVDLVDPPPNAGCSPGPQP